MKIGIGQVAFVQPDMFSLPPNTTNDWGLAEFAWRGSRWVVMGDICDRVEHRLPLATWENVVWFNGIHSHNFIRGVLYEHAISSWKPGMPNKVRFWDHINNPTPENIGGQLTRARAEILGADLRHVSMEWDATGYLGFVTHRGRVIEWTGDDKLGTLVADFGFEKGGSHTYLKQLIGYFGLPKEALRSIPLIE